MGLYCALSFIEASSFKALSLRHLTRLHCTTPFFHVPRKCSCSCREWCLKGNRRCSIFAHWADAAQRKFLFGFCNIPSEPTVSFQLSIHPRDATFYRLRTIFSVYPVKTLCESLRSSQICLISHPQTIWKEGLTSIRSVSIKLERMILPSY